MSLLENIESPEQLRALPREELPRVADELREELVRLGSEVGGHFAGSLGVVELSIALHHVFETPRDRVVWDVGHQGYAHKALTGRLAALPRIKRGDGPSGFLRRSESHYDVFGAGHAGTSVSAVLGIAEAQRRAGAGGRSVAVIGDGAATAGMAFEAFNHAGGLGTPCRVVFNDNGMSIAPNVGGLHGSDDARGYFEALGWRYLGPVDGHALAELLPALGMLRDAAGPTVLHVRTKKGAGYAPAEADPFRWHATAPFDRESGVRAKASSGPPSWTACFADALARLADRDERVVAITAAMPDGTGLDRFGERHPDRVYDVGIAEQHGVTFAAGLATEGLRPVCAIYSSFLQRGFDQIIHDVALQELPVVFALDRAGLVGADGPTHHGTFDLAYLRMIPHLVVCAPRDENQLQHLLATGIECGRPFAVRFPRGAAPGAALDPDAKPLPIGSGELLREGGDVTLVGLGKTVAVALAAAERLAEHGVAASVVDARFVKPLDVDLLASSACRTRRLFTLEDGALPGGFGSAVLEALVPRVPGLRAERLGLPDRFIEHGDVDAQWREAGLDVDSVVAQVRESLASPAPAPPAAAVAPTLREAYAHCAEVTRRADSSFGAAFWMFPRAQRRALHAIYAFCRFADDIADDPDVAGDRGALLARWRRELADAYRGRSRHPVGVALGDAARRYALPEAVFQDLLDGVERDLAGAPIETFEDLRGYCYQVASTVGLQIVRVLGATSPEALDYAANLGVAVQLTNVLRDVGDDAAQGRIYLAAEDLERFGVAPEELRAEGMSENLRLLIACYAERARLSYERAEQLLPREHRRRLRPAQAMGRIYRTLLDELHVRGFPCMGAGLRLTRRRRLGLAVGVWLGRGASRPA